MPKKGILTFEFVHTFRVFRVWFGADFNFLLGKKRRRANQAAMWWKENIGGKCLVFFLTKASLNINVRLGASLGF